MRSHSHYVLTSSETEQIQQPQEMETAKLHLLLACACPLFGKSLDVFSPDLFTTHALRDKK